MRSRKISPAGLYEIGQRTCELAEPEFILHFGHLPAPRLSSVSAPVAGSNRFVRQRHHWPRLIKHTILGDPHRSNFVLILILAVFCSVRSK